MAAPTTTWPLATPRRAVNYLLTGMLGLLLSCETTNGPIRIEGKLSNLPDGKMVLQSRNWITGKPTPIDTVDTRQGVFTFLIDRKAYPEPVHIELEHYQLGTRIHRSIFYLTNWGRPGPKQYCNSLMLEDGIRINGQLEESLAHRQPGGEIFISPRVDRPITAGRQTQAFYNDTTNFERITEVAKAKQILEQHAYSYHYLGQLERRAQYLSKEVFLALFACFEPAVQNSPTGQALLTYVTQRDSHRLSFATALVNQQGQPQAVLSQQARYNLLVLWASWCGPCRREIPVLKQLHDRLGDGQQLQLTSISVDEDHNDWTKALAQEQMPWPQLLMTPDLKRYAAEIFQYNHAVPLALLVDQRGKIVRRMEGYDAATLSAIEKTITQK